MFTSPHKKDVQQLCIAATNYMKEIHLKEETLIWLMVTEVSVCGPLGFKPVEAVHDAGGDSKGTAHLMMGRKWGQGCYNQVLPRRLSYEFIDEFIHS